MRGHPTNGYSGNPAFQFCSAMASPLAHHRDNEYFTRLLLQRAVQNPGSTSSDFLRIGRAARLMIHVVDCNHIRLSYLILLAAVNATWDILSSTGAHNFCPEGNGPRPISPVARCGPPFKHGDQTYGLVSSTLDP